MKNMASMMKQIMDFSYDMHKMYLEVDDYEMSNAWSTLENMANNCHGKNKNEIIDYLTSIGAKQDWSQEIMDYLNSL